MLYLQLAWRNLWRNRRRTLITIAAIFFAGFFVIFMRVFQLGAYDNMTRNMVGSYSGYIQIHENGYWDEKTLDNTFEESEELYQVIETTPGVEGVSPRLTGMSLISTGQKTRGAQVVGIDPEREFQLDLESRLDEGSAVPADGVVLGRELADFLGVQLGDSLVFIGQGYHGMSAYALLPVNGIAKFANPQLNGGIAIIDLRMAQYVFATDARLTELAINTSPDVDEVLVASQIKSQLDTAQYEVMTWQEIMPELVQSIEADSAGGVLMAGVLYLVISFSLLGTFIMLAAERKREYGMLVGLGMRKGQLIKVAALEAFLMAILGSALSIIGSRPLALYFNHNPIQFTGQALEAMKEMGMEASMPTSLDWSIPLTHGAVLIFLTMLVSAYGFISIKKLKPVNAMRA